MLHELIIAWDTFKSVTARDSIVVYYLPRPLGTDPETYHYDVFATNNVYFYHSALSDSGDISDFETNYQPAATEIGSRDDAIALTTPPVNASSVQQVELVSRVGRVGSSQWTICSPNWSRKTTWFQNYIEREDIACTPDGTYTNYDSGLTYWINPDDFTLAVQSYNKGAANGFGFNNLWLSNGTRTNKAAWRPVIKKNGVVQTSGYTIDYAAGIITFGSSLTNTDNVTISGRTVNSELGSAFVVRPVAGKKLVIPHVELNLSEDLNMTCSAVFEIWAGDPTYAFENGPVPEFLEAMGLTARDLYLQYIMVYDSMHQIVGLSTGKVTKMETIGGTSAVTASANTGWATNQKRGFSVPHYEILFDFGTPSEFGQPIVLPSSVYAQMRVRLGDETPFGGEYSSVTFYAEELGE